MRLCPIANVYFFIHNYFIKTVSLNKKKIKKVKFFKKVFFFIIKRKLRCPRNFVHINLFIAFGLRTILVILVDLLRNNSTLFDMKLDNHTANDSDYLSLVDNDSVIYILSKNLKSNKKIIFILGLHTMQTNNRVFPLFWLSLPRVYFFRSVLLNLIAPISIL